MLKGVILTCTDVVTQAGTVDQDMLRQVLQLLRFIVKNGVKPVVLSNTRWISKDGDGNERPLKNVFQEKIAALDWYSHNDDANVPPKPTANATEYVRQQYGWEANEVVYLGNSQSDMRTAVNGGILFLNASWYGNNTEYGYRFDSPKDVAKFIDVFCLRSHWWEFEIHDEGLDYYALSTFSTYKEKYAMTSRDAKSAAKHGKGHLEFWPRYLGSSLYFSGVYKDLDYITPYPGHASGVGNADIDESLAIFGRCFRTNYLPDLIVRHTTATKSQTARNKGVPIDLVNQLNTIRLNQAPTKNVAKGTTYSNSPLGKGKTVLVVDDFCTNGYSLEGARNYIEATGSKVILLTWLKMINSSYKRSDEVVIENPYTANSFESCGTSKSYPYGAHIVDAAAQTELHAKLDSYDDWDWPD